MPVRMRGSKEATMIVKSIIDNKGHDVLTIDPGASLDTAAKLLAERRIGAVVVLGADDRVVGILSERDIVRAISERGAGAMQEQVSQVMTRKVATCTLDETIHSIMERMTVGKFRHFPVIEQGRLAGIISIGDVVKNRIMEMEQESDALKNYIQTA
jgi:CBS domain-containing protein